jgi:hypothetical protein
MIIPKLHRISDISNQISAGEKTITAMAARFAVQLGGLVFIHSFLLKPDYLATASLWRAQEAQIERVWAMLLAILIYAIGAVLI